MLNYSLEGVRDVSKNRCPVFTLIWREHDITLRPRFLSLSVSLPKVNGTVGPFSVTLPARQSQRGPTFAKFLTFTCLKPIPAWFFLGTLAHHIRPLAWLWHCLFKFIIFHEASCSYACPKYNRSINFSWLCCLLNLMYSLQTDSYAY